MTRLRFLLVSFGAAVAARLGWHHKEQVRGLHVKTYKFTEMSNMRVGSAEWIRFHAERYRQHYGSRS